MTDTIELARVLVSLWPEASNLDKGVQQIASNAQDTFTRSSKVMGSQLAQNVEQGAVRAEGSLKKVEVASLAVAKARKAEADAAGRVQVAETKLEEVRSKSTATAAQRKTAEEAFNRAQRTHLDALDKLRKAEADHERSMRAADNTMRQMAGTAVNVLGGALDRAEHSVSRLGAGGEMLGGVLGSLGKNAGSLGEALMGAESGAAALGATVGAVTAGAITGLVAAATGAMKVLYDLGESYDNLATKLRFQTGATGPELEELKRATMAVANEVPLATEEIGKMTGEVHRSLGLASTDLIDVTTNIANLGRISGEPVNVSKLGSLFHMFNIDAKDQVSVLDSLKNAYQATQIPVNTLVDIAAKAGPTMKQIGMDIGQTTALLGLFDEAGLDPARMVEPLSKAMTTLARNGKSGPQVFREMVDEIRRLAQAGKDADAIKLGDKLFGGHGGFALVDAIKRNVFDVGKLDEALQRTGTTIKQDVDATKTFSDEWETLKNKASDALQPLSSEVFSFVDDGLQHLGDWVSTHQSDLVGFFQAMGDIAIYAGQGVGMFAGDLIEAVGDIMNIAGEVTGTWMQLRGVWDQILGNDEKAQQEFGRGHDFKQWGTDLQKQGQDLKKMFMERGDDVLNFWNKNADATKSALQLTEKLGKAKVSLGDDKTTVYIDTNEPEVTAKLDKIGLEVKQLPDGKFQVVPKTEEGQKVLDAWRDKTTGKKVEIPVTVDTTDVERKLDDLGKGTLSGGWRDKLYPSSNPTPEPVIGPPPVGAPNGVMPVMPPSGIPVLIMPPRATGGIFDVWNSVSSFADGKLPRTALIQPPVAGAGLVQWAEPSTGGEAFIPLKGGKRSIDIWAQTGHMLGVFDQGGYNGVTQDEINRMGGGTVNLSILQALRASNPSAVLTSARTDHDPDGGFHPKGMAIDVDPSSRNLDILWSMRDQLTQIIFDDPQRVWYNVGGQRAEGAAARAIYGESTMAQHRNHIHVAAAQPVGGGGQLPAGAYSAGAAGPAGVGNLTASSSKDEIASAIIGEATKRGFTPEQTQAILSTAMQESGLVMQDGGGGAWHGIFQQDSSYAGRDDPNQNIAEFFKRLQSKMSSPGASDDIWKNIFWLQQAPGALSADAAFAGGRQAYLKEIQSQSGAAATSYGRLSGGSSGGYSGPYVGPSGSMYDLRGRTGPLVNGFGPFYGPGVGTPGYNEQGQPGYFAQDPKQIREAQERVADADQRIRDADARVKEAEEKRKNLTAAASDLEVMQADNNVEKARRDADKARREAGDSRQDLQDAQRGKFTAAREGSSGMNGAGLVKDMLKGGLEFLGLDGSVFSNPMDWGIWKLFTGGANVFGKMMQNAYGGPQRGAFQSSGLGGFDFGGGGGISSVGDTVMSVLPQVGNYLPNSQQPIVNDNRIQFNGQVGHSDKEITDSIRGPMLSRDRSFSSALPGLP